MKMGMSNKNIAFYNFLADMARDQHFQFSYNKRKYLTKTSNMDAIPIPAVLTVYKYPYNHHAFSLIITSPHSLNQRFSILHFIKIVL